MKVSVFKYIWIFTWCLCAFAGVLRAQEIAWGEPIDPTTHVLAQVDAEQSIAQNGWFNRSTIQISLSEAVPYRVFTLANSLSVIIDFYEVDFSGLEPADFLADAHSGAINAVRFGTLRPGWSRFVADLSQPMLPTQISMRASEGQDGVMLKIDLKHVSSARYTAASHAPLTDADWSVITWEETRAPESPGDAGFVVMIDPGHGGIDPGAVRAGLTEKNLTLAMAVDLAQALEARAGVRVFMTRRDDRFVALPERVSRAHASKADVFVSLHADALAEGDAHGATLYTLSSEASGAASAQLAIQQNRSDIIAGIDLSGVDDQIAGILMDLARTETRPRSQSVADTLVAAIHDAGLPLNTRPTRYADFSVLKSPDIPSVLVEMGFMSSERDLANLRDPVWRKAMVEAIAQGIMEWRSSDDQQRSLVRQ